MTNQSLVARFRIQNEEQAVEGEEPGGAQLGRGGRGREIRWPQAHVRKEPADDTFCSLEHGVLEIVRDLGTMTPALDLEGSNRARTGGVCGEILCGADGIAR